jgi:hypothetical protein
MSPDAMAAALEHNRSRLLDAVEADEPEGTPRELILVAAEAAMLRRWSVIPGTPLPFGEPQLERARHVLAATSASDSPAASRIAATVHAALPTLHRC